MQRKSFMDEQIIHYPAGSFAECCREGESWLSTRQTASRYMMVEAFAQIDHEETDPILSPSTQAA